MDAKGIKFGVTLKIGLARVSRTKTEIKPVTLRMQASIKEAGERAAQLDHRNFTNFIENLVLQHCKSVGIEVTTNSKEPV